MAESSNTSSNTSLEQFRTARKSKSSYTCMLIELCNNVEEGWHVLASRAFILRLCTGRGTGRVVEGL